MTDDFLEITIRHKGAAFYSLFADGLVSAKSIDKNTGFARLFYPPGSVVFLYYTYPSYREALVIRNTALKAPAAAASVSPPGLSKPVSLLFRVRASKIDKLKRAGSFLNAHFKNAYSFSDGFYSRLYFLLSQKGKLNYYALRALAEAKESS
jgi:hypothetical protein